jgi:enamine deaminase RidA (YjgF/YER057c/UK114 family)
MHELTRALGFPQVVRVGETIYVGASIATHLNGIETQTAESFEGLMSLLERAGARPADLINLRTYYVYAGAEGRDVTEYWEKMTAVRLRYIADPGPAATALRVCGVPDARVLIGADGIATLDPRRQRIMPRHSWDWSIPVPLSQGWRIDERIVVGGQISADRSGKALAAGDVRQQARNALEYIRHVLTDGGQSWSDVVSLRLCFKHTGNTGAAASLLDDIVNTLCEVIPEPRPALTVLGVNLLYEGLMLEIDAMSLAVSGRRATEIISRAEKARSEFPTAVATENELHIGGLAGAADSPLEEQIDMTLLGLEGLLRNSGFEASELVKLTLCLVPESGQQGWEADHELAVRQLRKRFPTSGPVLTLLSLPGLARAGQRFQLDGIAVRGSDRSSF